MSQFHPEGEPSIKPSVYYMDGTCLSLSQFDRLAENEGYARTIERTKNNMASSHQMKRFCKNVSFRNNHQFRRMLLDLIKI